MASRQLSSTVRSAKRLVIWKVRARPWAARRCVGAPVTSRPKSVMAPALTGSDPEMRLNSVVFPAPFGPMTARRSPGRTASDTPPTACSPPKYFETPSSLRAKSALRRALPLAVLAWGMVSRIERLLQKLLRVVLPELAHRRVGEDHAVLEVAAHALDLPHVDVLDGIAPAVDDHGAAGEVLQLDLPQGGQERLAVLDLAVDRLDRFHDPARVGVAGLPVVGGHLAHLGLEGLGELLVGGIVEGRRVVQRGVDAQRLVAHLRQHRLVGDGAVAEEGELGLEPRVRVLLHELQRAPAEEDGEDGVGVPLDLGQERREVRRVQGHPDLLHDLAALLLEGALEAAHRLPTESVIEGDHGDLLVLE